MVWIIAPNRALILINRMRTRQNLAADASELFWAFFTEAYPSREAYMDRMRFLGGTLAERPDSFTKEVRETLDESVRDPDFGIDFVVNEIDGLRQEFDLPYAPDGMGDDVEALIAAVHIHAIHLARMYRIHDSLLSDDVRASVRKVTSLRERLWHLQGKPNLMEDVLGPDLVVARVDVEIAVTDGDYERALRLMADNLPKEMLSEVRLGANAPDKERWTFDGIGQRIVNWIQVLKGRLNTDWDEVLKLFDRITLGTFCAGEEATDNDGFTGPLMYYDILLKEWIKGSLSLPEIRSLWEKSEDVDAARRLQVYYFGDGWQTLPNRARAALVNADRAFVARSDSGRTAAILNELRIAAEELLHSRLWEPLIAWADEQKDYRTSPDFAEIRFARERAHRKSPSLETYEPLLRDGIAVVRFLREQVGVDEKGLRFIKQQAAKSLKRLRQARNAAEHNPGHEANLAKIRDRYAEAVGIGREGVLPELARLLGGGRGRASSATATEE